LRPKKKWCIPTLSVASSWRFSPRKVFCNDIGNLWKNRNTALFAAKSQVGPSSDFPCHPSDVGAPLCAARLAVGEREGAGWCLGAGCACKPSFLAAYPLLPRARWWGGGAYQKTDTYVPEKPFVAFCGGFWYKEKPPREGISEGFIRWDEACQSHTPRLLQDPMY
jgi:hypothetical protein